MSSTADPASMSVVTGRGSMSRNVRLASSRYAAQKKAASSESANPRPLTELKGPPSTTTPAPASTIHT